MVINFCFDDLGPNPDLGRPNLAVTDIETAQFDTTWPYVIPLRLLMYLRRAGIVFRTWHIEQAPLGSWYPVALGYHAHDIDYFALMPDSTQDALRQQRIRVLFYYHEGDNPALIKQIMDHWAINNNLSTDCYRFVSANSRSSTIDGFYFFSDHEYFFQYVNRQQPVAAPDIRPRRYQFTALSRTHKWWRAAIMSDMHARDLLRHSQYSYHHNNDVVDDPAQNPLRIHEFSHWDTQLQQFMQGVPYVCDSADTDLHNDHRMVNTALYDHSYCHVVLETHLDADHSNGAFITEKTYKCLKYAQPFVVAGTVGTLACLRDQGYRVFDHVLDNRYDCIKDNTLRWLTLRGVLQDLASQDMHAWFRRCESDLRHNQALFLCTKKPDLLQLAQYLDTVE